MHNTSTVQFDSSLSPWGKFDFGDISIYFAGNILVDEDVLTGHKAADYIRKWQDSENLTLESCNKFTEINGQFAFIQESKNQILAFMDRIRSFPIYHTVKEDSILISNNAYILKESSKNPLIDQKGLLEFKMAGYCLEDRTIFENIKQLQAGNFILQDKNSTESKIVRYYSFFNEDCLSISRKNLLKKIDETIDESIQETIRIANGRTIIIPLSAGLDSRLILGKLKAFNYPKIFCYTYGPKHIWEAKVARKLAEFCEVPWEFVELKQNDKVLFHTESRKKYYDDYSGFCSIPHLSDYYALQKLEEMGHIKKEDSIIVNGQTGDFISGGHIPLGIISASKQDLLENITQKHFALWIDLNTPENNQVIAETIHNYLNYQEDKSGQIKAKKVELFECHERQFKYVINGQRAYDYLGYDWHLPLWSRSMLSLWDIVGLSDKMGQIAYKEYCTSYNPYKLFSIKEKKSHNSLPPLLELAMLGVKVLHKINRKIDKAAIRRRYFNYFDKYAPYYPMASYSEYLKDSKYHRHCVSYWVKYFLKENEIK